MKTNLLELNDWSKSLPSRREVHSKQWYLLSQAKMSWAPEHIVSCGKALLAATKSFMRNDMAVIFDQYDIDKMNVKNATMQKSVDIQRKAREWVCSIGLDPEKEPKMHWILGLLDVRLCMHAHSKTCKERASYKDLEIIGSHFVRQVYDLSNSKAFDASLYPFAILPLASEASGEPKLGVAPMRELADGQVSRITIESLGFKVGVLRHLRGTPTDRGKLLGRCDQIKVRA